jgi:TolA-binding protein
MKTLLRLIVVSIAGVASAGPLTTCGLTGSYAAALCAYQRRSFTEAEAGFRAIAESGQAEAQTLHAMYFLARTEMKRGRFDEASTLFVRIYGLDQSFYEAWNCDFLLGECRRATGKD